MKRVVLFIVVFAFAVMAFGCTSFNANKVAEGTAIGVMQAALNNNPSYKPKVCEGLVALDNALNADCCWKDYLQTINNTWNDPKYSPYAAGIITVLSDDAPLLSYVNMSDTDKANIRKILGDVTGGIGCK